MMDSYCLTTQMETHQPGSTKVSLELVPAWTTTMLLNQQNRLHPISEFILDLSPVVSPSKAYLRHVFFYWGLILTSRNIFLI